MDALTSASVGDIYAARDAAGSFVVFWKVGNDIMHFAPDEYGRQFTKKDMGEWDVTKASYLLSDDKFGDYEDIINAGWHYFGMRYAPLDKNSARLSKMKPGKYYPRMRVLS